MMAICLVVFCLVALVAVHALEYVQDSSASRRRQRALESFRWPE